jgi:RNA polymerase sigma factor (sigma-70 family)
VPDMHQKAAAKDLQGTDVRVTELRVTHAALMKYRGAMAGVVRSMGVNGPTVEDVVHDAFEMACRKSETDRPDPTDEVRFKGWLCTLAKFAAMSTRNDSARSREISSPAEELEDVPEHHRAYIGHFDDKVAAAFVFASMGAEDCRLLREYFYEDKTVQELAAEHGVPWTTMRSRLDSVIERARMIMVDSKTNRRRSLAAIILIGLSFRFREAYAQLQSNRSSYKRLAVGGAACAAVLTVVLHQPSDANASKDRSHVIASKGDAAASSAAWHALHIGGIGIAPLPGGGAAASAVATPADTSSKAANKGFCYSDRHVTEWSISNKIYPGGNLKKTSSIP